MHFGAKVAPQIFQRPLTSTPALVLVLALKHRHHDDRNTMLNSSNAIQRLAQRLSQLARPTPVVRSQHYADQICMDGTN